MGPSDSPVSPSPRRPGALAQLEVPTSGQREPPGHVGWVWPVSGRPAPPSPENRQPDLECHFILVGVWRATIKGLFGAIRDPEGAVRGTPRSSPSSHPNLWPADPSPFLLLGEADLWEAEAGVGPEGFPSRLCTAAGCSERGPKSSRGSDAGAGGPGEGAGRRGSTGRSTYPPAECGVGSVFPHLPPQPL